MGNPIVTSAMTLAGATASGKKLAATEQGTLALQAGNTVQTAADLQGLKSVNASIDLEFPDGSKATVAGWLTGPSVTYSAAATESPNKTVITTVGPAIVDKNGDKWTITNDAKVAKNGATDPTTGNVTTLAYVLSTVWQQNKFGSWYAWSGAAWGPGLMTSPLGGNPTTSPAPTTSAPVTTAPPVTTSPPVTTAPTPGSASISLTLAAVSPAPKQGINWGGIGYYDPSISRANIMFSDGPSFEPTVKRPMQIPGGNITPNQFQDGWPYTKTPDDHWKGAAYTVLTGKNAGTTGTVVASKTAYNPNSGPGTTYTLDKNLPGLTSQDRIQFDLQLNSLKGPDGENYIPGWRFPFTGDAQIVSGDVPADSWGTYALKVDASSADFSMQNEVDTWDGENFLTLNGPHRFTFKYKVLSGAPSFVVNFYRDTPNRQDLINDSQAFVTGDWQTGTIQFNASETASTPAGVLRFLFEVHGGVVLLDDFWLGADQDIGYAIRKSFRDMLPKLGMNDLRWWDGQGRRFLDWIKPMDYRQPHSPTVMCVSGDGTYQDNNLHVCSMSLPDAVKITRDAGCRRIHLVFDVGWGATEIQQFMRWAEGDASDSLGALRIKAGIPQPLSQLFDEARCSLGNETWGTAYGETDPDIWDDAANKPVSAYTARVAALTAAMHTCAQYKPCYKLIACEQRGNPSRQQLFPSGDGAEVMQYFGSGPTGDEGMTGTTPDQIFDAMHKEILARVTDPKDQWYAQLATLAGAKLPMPHVYEWAISCEKKSNLTQANKNLAASAFIANMALSLMIEVSKKWNLPSWMFFCLPQYLEPGNGAGGQGLALPIWGAVRSIEGNKGYLPRPVMLQLQLFNWANLGYRVQTTAANVPKTAAGNPAITWDAFTDKAGNYGIILVNNDRSNAQTVSLGIAPKGTISTQTIVSTNATDDNETTQTVSMVSGTMPATSTITLKPHSILALRFTA